LHGGEPDGPNQDQDDQGEDEPDVADKVNGIQQVVEFEKPKRVAQRRQLEEERRYRSRALSG